MLLPLFLRFMGNHTAAGQTPCVAVYDRLTGFYKLMRTLRCFVLLIMSSSRRLFK